MPVSAKMIGGGRPLLPQILGQTGRVGAQSPIFDLFSAVTPIEKSSINTNRKSHTGFRFIPTSMTLNYHERRNRPYFAFLSAEFDCFAGQIRHAG